MESPGREGPPGRGPAARGRPEAQGHADDLRQRPRARPRGGRGARGARRRRARHPARRAGLRVAPSSPPAPVRRPELHPALRTFDEARRRSSSPSSPCSPRAAAPRTTRPPRRSRTSSCPASTRASSPRARSTSSPSTCASCPPRARTSPSPWRSACSRSARASASLRRRAIAKAVREGFSRDQVEDLYKRRFDAPRRPPSRSPARRRGGRRTRTSCWSSSRTSSAPSARRSRRSSTTLWEKRKDKVRFVYKFMPLTMHPHAEIAARAAIAAQMQGKFWEMHHLLFANGQHLEQADLEKYAASVGLDVDRFRADMQSRRGQGAHRRRPQARRRPEGPRHADALHRRPRVRLRRSTSASGSTRRLPRASERGNALPREGGRAGRMRVLPDGATLRRDRAPAARRHARAARGAGGRRGLGRAPHRARRRRDDRAATPRSTASSRWASPLRAAGRSSSERTGW